jgi:hypothetical protein
MKTTTTSETAMIETIKAAGAAVAFPKVGSMGSPDGVLVYGETASVRRAAAALGLSFARLSDKVTDLYLDGHGYVGHLGGENGRSCFTISESAWQKMQ